MLSWFFDMYSKYKRFSPASITGKVSLCWLVTCLCYACYMPLTGLLRACYLSATA